MRVDQRLGNGQAKPESSKPASDIALSLFKRVKNFADCFGLNANPGVGNAYLDLVRRRIQSFDTDAAFFRGELDAVLDQVPKNLLQACWIAFHVGVNCAKSEVHLKVRCLDFLAAYLVSAVDDLMDRNRFEA